MLSKNPYAIGLWILGGFLPRGRRCGSELSFLSRNQRRQPIRWVAQKPERHRLEILHDGSEVEFVEST